MKWPIACSSPPVNSRINGWQNWGNAADINPKITPPTIIVVVSPKPWAFIIKVNTQAKNKLCPVVKNIFLNFVIRAKTMFNINPSISVQETAKPYVPWARAVAASGEAITPVIPKPYSNSLLKFCNAPVIALAPIPNIKNPITVFAAPVNTSTADFFWSINPINATKPSNIAGVLNKLIINSIVNLLFC